MKAVIWIGCLLISSIIKVLLIGSASMGAIPTIILYGGTAAVARSLCKQWDKHKSNNRRSY